MNLFSWFGKNERFGSIKTNGGKYKQMGFYTCFYALEMNGETCMNNLFAIA
ncbi:hypothetical protein [Salicibibacter halophilus]|uniref:hypothetical protein n=1 Tax=Salicibibacter halophilus TaxID=2502791 RepID=UPI001D042468|nr:hypothetical protein [Salicibibacter halophilus]